MNSGIFGLNLRRYRVRWGFLLESSVLLVLSFDNSVWARGKPYSWNGIVKKNIGIKKVDKILFHSLLFTVTPCELMFILGYYMILFMFLLFVSFTGP